MELRVLKYFLAVAREQSISKAAESLYLSQPTLSRQLRELEDELGKRLFVRGNRKITLTDEGMLLRKRAEEIIDLVEKTESEITSSDDVIAGTVYIGAGETDAMRLVAKVAQKVQRDFPQIKFHLYSSDSLDVSDKLNKGLLDFGIVFEPADLSKFEHFSIPISDTWGVLMRRDSELAAKAEISPEDLWDKPLIVSRQQDRSSKLSKWIKKPFDSLNVSVSYNLVYNASIMVDEGMGYALTIDKLINVSGDSNLCFRPLNPPLSANMHFVWKWYQVFSKPAEIFLKYFTDELESDKS